MGRKNRRAPAPTRGRRQEFRRGRPKPCPYCKDEHPVDWKDIPSLRKHLSDRGKIRGRRVTGLCPKHQRDIATATKNAREMGLLPYLSAR